MADTHARTTRATPERTMVTTPPSLDWTELDEKAVDTVRVLAMDAVQKVGNGHPGTAMSLAPAAYLLFQKVMRHNPADPHWPGRDRFVLSCGHSSLTLYLQLFLGLWARARRHRGVAHVGQQNTGPPGARPHRRRRDHDRSARPRHRQRGRYGHGRSPRARHARPQRGRGRPSPSTTTSTRSAATVTSRRASAARPPRSPGPSGWAT